MPPAHVIQFRKHRRALQCLKASGTNGLTHDVQDVNKDTMAHERFSRMTRAYNVLSDPQQRAQYDMQRQPVPNVRDTSRPYVHSVDPLYEAMRRHQEKRRHGHRSSFWNTEQQWYAERPCSSEATAIHAVCKSCAGSTSCIAGVQEGLQGALGAAEARQQGHKAEAGTDAHAHAASACSPGGARTLRSVARTFRCHKARSHCSVVLCSEHVTHLLLLAAATSGRCRTSREHSYTVKNVMVAAHSAIILTGNHAPAYYLPFTLFCLTVPA
jgi:curved DNA-binding protein CbpA